MTYNTPIHSTNIIITIVLRDVIIKLTDFSNLSQILGGLPCVWLNFITDLTLCKDMLAESPDNSSWKSYTK